MNAFDSKTVTRLAGVSLRQIQYWDEQGIICPSVQRAAGKGTRRLYSFTDLVKLRLARGLLDYGMTPSRIRACLSHLNGFAADPTDSSKALKYLTDGRKRFVITDDHEKILEVLDDPFVFSLGIGNVVDELNGRVRRLATGRPTGGMRRELPGPGNGGRGVM